MCDVCVQATVNGTGGGGGDSPTKPVPPPRDHLRVDKDGRLVSKAPPPQLPARLTDNINNNTTTPPPVPVPAVPDTVELSAIRKYQVLPFAIN